MDLLITSRFHNLSNIYIIKTIAEIFSGVGVYAYIYIIIFLAILYFTYQKIGKKIFFLGIIVIFFGLFVDLIKNISHRDRPYIINAWQNDFCPVNFSFPSGHSELAIILGLLLGYIFPKHTYLYIFIAILVGVSRMILGCHYASDVLGGFLVGILGFFTIKVILKKIGQNN